MEGRCLYISKQALQINSSMDRAYNPKNYNSLSAYLIVTDAEELVDLLKIIFAAKELRRFKDEKGRIAHLELKLDDTILMISNSTDSYPANTAMLHLYMPDVFYTFNLAVENNCTIIKQATSKKGHPDTRGTFIDFAGNYWAISTQMNQL